MQDTGTTTAVVEERDGGVILEELFAALERGDDEALVSLVADDYVMEWPQSGERFVSRDNAIAALRAQDDTPTMTGVPRIVGSGDVWVAMVSLTYASGPIAYVGVFELRDGRIARATESFGEPFAAKEARAPYREQG